VRKILLICGLLLGCTTQNEAHHQTDELTVNCPKDSLTVTNPSDWVMRSEFACSHEGYIIERSR